VGRTKTFYEIDDNLFEKIDCEEKAYILGFVAADGYISPEGKVIISIHPKDTDILEKIRDFVCKDIPIQVNGKCVRLLIARKKIAEDMSKHLKIEFGKAKSFTIKYPDIAKNLDKDFIRGYFDGDGHITTNLEKRHIFYSGFTSGSRDMLEAIVAKYEPTKIMKHRTKHAWYIKFYSRHGIRFAHYIYKDAKIYLARKYNLYLEWKNIFNKANKIGKFIGVRMFSDIGE
jgi:hypothetical protein